MVEVAPELMRAVLVGVQFPSVSDTEHAANLAELGRLVSTLGYEVVGEVSQRRKGLSRSAVLGEGKLAELAEMTGGTGIVTYYENKDISKAKQKWQAAEADNEQEESTEPSNDDEEETDTYAGDEASKRKSVKATVVVVDHELTPSQLRNLERAVGVSVLDRSGVIVDIFHRHARSREARMQVEIARLAYLAPRLREASGPSERQAGRGTGDTAIELDRRRIRDRVAELHRELAAVQTSNAERR
ncbi:MAG: GTPase HflX, partial [Clostridia bacterium]|nr:GTPase HflX [Deltaproteobacteria bacterium]